MIVIMQVTVHKTAALNPILPTFISYFMPTQTPNTTDVTPARASISQDYWGDIKEDWGSGGQKSPSGVQGGASVEGVQGQSPGRGSGDDVPQKLKLFCETTHNICIKIQQTTVAVT